MVALQPFLAGAAKTGRRVVTDLCEGLNAIRYMARSGGGWRMLPKDFPPISVAVETPYGHAHGLRQLAGTSPGLTTEQQATIKALNAGYAKLEAEYEHANELAADVDERLPGAATAALIVGTPTKSDMRHSANRMIALFCNDFLIWHDICGGSPA
ncbi:putative transposase of IS4/5 family DUF4096 [Mesorhizobium loti]|uniref:Putative transposase of IS4/5 family DUF4096 n=1 Tax=Rhizobium loti TaxID=381 RepID=A0A8E2W5Y5_RHILI|nr:putative transposase of IS4/5 family DUF4096 [Mesorhizobium loti]